MDRRRFLALGGASLSAFILDAANAPAVKGRRGTKREEFDLRIRIGGLCLLVPDPPKQRLHVLLPATGGVHEHQAVVAYRGADNTFEIPLGGEFDLTTFVRSVDSLDTLPADVVDLSDVVLNGVSRRLIETCPPQRVRCHMTLPAGDVFHSVKGHVWEIERLEDRPKRQYMATDLFWAFPVTGRSLRLGEILPGAPELLPERDPRSGLSTVDLEILHIPPRGYPPTDPEYNEEAEHFSYYYVLLDRDLRDPPIPRYRGKELGLLPPPQHRLVSTSGASMMVGGTYAERAELGRQVPGSGPWLPFYSNPRCILATASIEG